MKYLIPTLTLLLILLATACQHPDSTKTTDTPETPAATPPAKEIKVSSNKNLDFLFAIHSQLYTPFLWEGVDDEMLANTQLMKMCYEHFKEFKDHEVIQQVDEHLHRSGTNFFLYAFYYDQFPAFERTKTIPDILLKELNEDPALALQEIDSLMKGVATLYATTEFEKFRQEHDYVYTKAVEEVSANLPNADFIPFLEDYFGNTYSDYKFLVIPFYKAEFGMAFPIQFDDQVENLTFIGPFEPARISEDQQVDYVGYNSKEDVLEWVIHEYSHLFYYPSLSQPGLLDTLNTFAHLYKPLPDSPQIGDWFSVFGEGIAVAFEVRAAELLGDEARKQKILERHKDWYYLPHFIDQLIIYENNRDQYPNIDAFMPDLIASCGELE